METVTLADVKARLSELVERAASGESVRKPIGVDWLRALTAMMEAQPETAGDFVRRMRDEDRY